MSKMRIVQPRVHDDENALDLRGLGYEKIIQDKYPWTFLTVKNVAESHIEKAAHVFELHFKKGKHHHEYHLFQKGPQDHTQKSLTLFTAGLLLLSKANDGHFLLGQLDSLGERMKAHDHPIDELHEESSPDHKSWNNTHTGMTVSESCKIYLSHAGIHLESSLVTHHEVNHLISTVQPTTLSLKKVS